MTAGFAQIESLPLALAVAAALGAAVLPRARRVLTAAAAAGFWLALAWLAWHLLADHFHVRYVWLYSGAGLPWHLKLANLWGGDQGTLLFLAALFAALAMTMRRGTGWARPGLLLFAAAFGAGALIWSPFEPTPAAQLAELPYRGMNAHLMVVWMALHPPLLFLAYALLAAPAGAALGALVGRPNDFVPVADRYLRAGWLLLTTGIAVGMWWAFEDFTFGQVWHWDPVQTSVFAVWATSTAVLHGLRRQRPGTVYARILPLLSLLTVAAMLVSMAVTRNGLLQSSHRYVGETSLPLFVVLVIMVLVLMLVGGIIAMRRGRARPVRGPLDRWVMTAIGLFLVVAMVALGMLGHALVAATMELPRAEGTKPFFEMLMRWSTGDEAARLERIFETWDVDGFALNRLLAPLGVVLAVVGGHVFLSLTMRRGAWAASLLALVAALAIPNFWRPIDGLFTGTGMTSQKTVAIFYWLDALLTAAGFFVLATLAWLMVQFRRRLSARGLRYVLPLAVVHAGAMVALVAVIFATVLDRYVQAELSWPEVLHDAQPIPGGFAIRLAVDDAVRHADGGRRTAGDAGFRAMARVSLALEGAGDERRDGRILYRDARVPPTGIGAVRELCRILDYRYARFLDDGSSRLDPFIYRDFWRDIQVWIPPAGFEETDDVIAPRDTDLLVVIRIFPLMSWLWIGLAAIVLAAIVLTVEAWLRTGAKPRKSDTRPVPGQAGM